MKRAKAETPNTVSVEFYTAQFQEDRSIIPEGFQPTSDLQRSVLDINRFSRPRKLPLIKDILDRLSEASNADYFIFTNIDIALMPQFYQFVEHAILQGHDAFTINRRRIGKQFLDIGDVSLIYSESGKSHPGFDCFVFKRSLYQKFRLANICVGVPFIGVSLLHNLMAWANNYQMYTDKHLTLHLGMEVLPKRDPEYYRHNRSEFKKILKVVKPHIKPGNVPYRELPLIQRITKRAANPSTFTLLCAELEVKGWWQKLKLRGNEARYDFLEKS